MTVRHALDPVLFAVERLGFTPDEKQRTVLELGISRGMLCCSRQWGKSTVTAIKAVHRAWFEDESLVLVLSPSARQSAEFLRKAAGFVRTLGERVRGDGANDISIALKNGSRIVGLPGTDGTIRGFSKVSMLLIDEAARVRDDLYRAMRPVLAVSQGDLWLMSTPYGKRGFFWETWTKGGERWTRVCAPATECERIPAEFLAVIEACIHGRGAVKPGQQLSPE